MKNRGVQVFGVFLMWCVAFPNQYGCGIREMEEKDLYESVRYDLKRTPYGRKHSFLYAGVWEEEGFVQVYVCALLKELDIPLQRGGRNGRLFPIILRRNGEKLSYEAIGTPTCVLLNYEDGTARICLQKGDILRIEAENADIEIPVDLRVHEIAKNRNDGSWEVAMNPAPKFLLCSTRGTMDAHTSFDVYNSEAGDTHFLFKMDSEGKSGVAVHLYVSNARRMRAYPAFEACISEIEVEFETYLNTVPELPVAWSQARILAAYLVWSHIMSLNGVDAIYMNKGVHRAAFSWQQSYQAMGQYKNPEFAWKLLCAMLPYQDVYGMFPDSVTDAFVSFSGTKPPIQGFAWAFLSNYTDFSFVPDSEIKKLYDGIANLVYWWLSYRDTDGDFIPQYDSADESGWDDCSMFRLGVPTESPDLAAYMVLAMEALAQMANRLGKTYEEREWKRRSEDMLKALLEFFWDGERFVPRVNATHEPVENGSLASFIPLILGKRLPNEIIQKMACDLSKEGKWLTPYGLAGESLDSPYYRQTGWIAGPILAPAQFVICVGLRECGQVELAKTIATRYCSALVQSGFAMVMNSETGEDSSDGRWPSRYPNRM